MALCGKGDRVDYIMAVLGIDFRLGRPGLLYLWQKAKGCRADGVRVSSDDLPVFRFQHHSSCRNRGRAHRASLLH